MTMLQKSVIVGTLLPIVLFLHVFSCDWDAGSDYTGTAPGAPLRYYDGSCERAIIPFGGSDATSGIVARSQETLGRDALLGIALPFLLVGASLFVIVTPVQERRATASGE